MSEKAYAFGDDKAMAPYIELAGILIVSWENEDAVTAGASWRSNIFSIQRRSSFNQDSAFSTSFALSPSVLITLLNTLLRLSNVLFA